MTVPTHQFEAKVRNATRRSSKSGDWYSVTLEVHPTDFPEELHDMAVAQQRVMAVIAAVSDNEEPLPSQARSDPTRPEKPKRAPATTRAEKARRLCGVKQFQAWMGCASYEATSRAVKDRVGVTTKANLDELSGPKERWDALLSEYEQQAGRMAERH